MSVARLQADGAEAASRQAAGPRRKLFNGAEFLLDADLSTPAVWGQAGEVLWPAREALWVAASPGLGKSTIGLQLAFRRAGLGLDDGLLGLPVEQDERPVLYVAADRPWQIRRSARRMVTESDRVALAERLRFWEGPLAFSLGDEPTRLANFAREHGVGTVVIDNLGNVAVDLTKDEVGSRVNLAMGHLLSEGVEVCVLHHNRKQGREGSRELRTLDDVYGSAWLTNGAGSVVGLSGQAGDPVVKLRHLKFPVEEVGPLDVRHDPETGEVVVHERADLVDLLRRKGHLGVTAREAATEIFATSEPTDAQTEKARRKLNKLVKAGVATSYEDGPRGVRFVLAEVVR